MKKLSLMIACVGIISAAAFGSGLHKTNPQNDSKKQKEQEVAKPGARTEAGKPIEVAKPVQTITATPAKPATTEPAKQAPKRVPVNAKVQAAPEKMQATPAEKKK